MKVKKIPMRTCVITREKLEKKDLIRVVRTPEHEIKIDLGGKMNGRGAYIKKDKCVIDKAKKNKALSRHLECDIPDSIYLELYKMIGEDNNG